MKLLGKLTCWLTRRHKWRYRQIAWADITHQREAYCTRCGAARPVRAKKEKAV